MSKGKTVSAALLVMLLWGALFPLVKLGYGAYKIASVGDILLFAGVRFAFCGTIISLFDFCRNKRNFKAAKAYLLPILVSGLFAIVLHYGFTYVGLKMTDSSKTAILKQVGVLLYICFSGFFFKDDEVTAKKLIGAFLGFAGIIVINFSDGKIAWHIGDILIISASFCTVVSNIISKRIFKNVAPVTVTGISQAFGGFVLVAAGVMLGGRASLPADFSVLIFVLICAASVISYCLWFKIVKESSLSRLFIIKFAEPVFAGIFGMLLLGENALNFRYLSAFLLIALGILISNY